MLQLSCIWLALKLILRSHRTPDTLFQFCHPDCILCIIAASKSPFSANVASRTLVRNTGPAKINETLWFGHVCKQQELLQWTVEEEGLDRCGWITSKTGHCCPLTTSSTQGQTGIMAEVSFCAPHSRDGWLIEDWAVSSSLALCQALQADRVKGQIMSIISLSD